MGVKWLIKDNKRAIEEGRKRKRYFETTLDSILNHWNGQDLKFIRLEYGKSYIDLLIYNSEVFTKNSGIYGGVVILDSYQLMLETSWVKSETFQEVFSDTFKKKINTGKKVDIKYWFDMKRMKNTLEELEKTMSLLEEYKIMDKLLGCDENDNNNLLFVS